MKGNLHQSMHSNLVLKQAIISLSSTEQEYKATVVATCEAIWLRRILGHLELPQDDPTQLFCDNQSAIQLLKNLVFHARTNHVEVHHHFI